MAHPPRAPTVAPLPTTMVTTAGDRPIGGLSDFSIRLANATAVVAAPRTAPVTMYGHRRWGRATFSAPSCGGDAAGAAWRTPTRVTARCCASSGAGASMTDAAIAHATMEWRSALFTGG